MSTAIIRDKTLRVLGFISVLQIKDVANVIVYARLDFVQRGIALV